MAARDIDLGNGGTGRDISLSSGATISWGKVKVAGVFVDILDRKVKIGGVFVSALGYKVKVGGTFVDLV